MRLNWPVGGALGMGGTLVGTVLLLSTISGPLATPRLGVLSGMQSFLACVVGRVDDGAVPTGSAGGVGSGAAARLGPEEGDSPLAVPSCLEGATHVQWLETAWMARC
ncbi:MAG: hypothetical protein HY727_20080 [Candidatus Rokubacteria bacterium]|nr:hypothetical protein [Candidatus Rokubacteria bacterium]